MAITTFTELQSAVAFRMGNRTDATNTIRIPEYISTAEAEMQRKLKTADQELSTTLTTTANVPTVALPAGFTKPRRIRRLIDGVYTDIWNVSLAGDGQVSTNGRPVVVSIQGANLVIKPTPDGTYSLPMDYWGKFTPLSIAAPVNWILTSHQDCYLYGALAHGFYATGNIDRGDSFLTKFLAIIDDINEDDADKVFGDEVLRTEVSQLNPHRSYNIRAG